MDKYVETLDALMKAKKEKKKPTIKEKEAFRSAWLGLVADTGLVGRAEQYLYEGFTFCGAEPFYTEPVTFHQARPHTEQDLEIYRIVVDTWNRTGTRVSYVDLPANLRTHQNTDSFLDRFKVVAGNLPYAQTIVAHIARDGHYFIHPNIEQNRSITPREAARIQTFPDNYYFESKKGIPSRTLAYKQIGNAVPVCLAYHVATALLDRFDEHN